MKFIYVFLLCLLLSLISLGQSNFNEPPTRSEFEQLKSKIQVYERTQNNVLSKMNSINSVIDDAMLKIDSVMIQKQLYMDSVMNKMALESQGLQEEVVARFLTAEDLAPLNQRIEEKSKIHEESDKNSLMIALGAAAFVLILLIVHWVLSGILIKRTKNDLLLKLDEDLSVIKSEMDALTLDLTNKFSLLDTDTKKSLDDFRKDNERKISSVSTQNELAIKTLEDKSEINFSEVKKIAENLVKDVKDELNQSLKNHEAEADVKNSEMKNMYEKSLKTLEKKLADMSKLIDKLGAEMKDLK
jgi:prolyl oligopeptidase PreP (S9A serine peptidase family)